MKVSDLGEFNLIELIAGIIKKSEDNWSPGNKNKIKDRIILGIGDDTAAWHTSSSIELATTDTMVQDVHFTLDTIDWESLGWKIMAVNVSDIAAMGGIPYYALITLCLPPDTEVDDIRKLYKGIADIGSEYGVAIVGGDIVRSTKVIITASLTGISYNKSILTRNSAVTGDLIAVTGTLGASAAGLLMFNQKLKFEHNTSSILKDAYLRPQPHIKEGNILVSNEIKTAMDISDGLVDDLSKLCKASKVEARVFVDNVPVNPVVKSNFNNALELALSGGEDYELLFTGKIKSIERIKKLIQIPITVIGEIMNGRPGKVTLLNNIGKEIIINKGGWDHFQKNS